MQYSTRMIKMAKTKKFLKDLKYWSWWEQHTPEEQERVLKTVYLMQEQNIWYEVDE